MRHLRTFFRHCPSCGRRFEIRLVSKVEIASGSFEEKVGAELASATVGEEETAVRALGIVPNTIRTVLQQETPNVVDVEEFRYTYKCRHCGHEWSEVQETERSLGEIKGYTGD